eukprot:TRINITY_DN194_c0_g1_i1.p1 TRINITY_DN194_c0_g1~~TRINITY_DN194_c0_g1_i1.p1  ORF type:complete len:269 (+),score=70.17 TRINITY_DN194_c0_g1_i1:86-892(+)
MLKVSLLLVVASLLLVSGCIPNKKAKYRATLQGEWAADTHPSYPTSLNNYRGFGYLIGATHTAQHDIFVWDEDRVASNGLKSLLRTASPRRLREEIVNLRNNHRACSPFSIDSNTFPTANNSVSFEISKTRPFVSVVARLFNSPDWFVGVSRVALYDSDAHTEHGTLRPQWIRKITIDLYAWDGGVADGNAFIADPLTAPETTPQQAIKSLRGSAPFDTDSLPLGSITFERTDDDDLKIGDITYTASQLLKIPKGSSIELIQEENKCH